MVGFISLHWNVTSTEVGIICRYPNGNGVEKSPNQIKSRCGSANLILKNPDFEESFSKSIDISFLNLTSSEIIIFI